MSKSCPHCGGCLSAQKRKVAKSNIVCIPQPDGQYLWEENGNKFYTSFPHDAARFETIIRKHKAASLAHLKAKSSYLSPPYIDSGFPVGRTL